MKNKSTKKSKEDIEVSGIAVSEREINCPP
jgi:hypothetical protein